MRKLWRYLHVIGFVLLLGSILGFIVISSLARGGGLDRLVFARQLIDAGTRWLTLPGLGLVALSGAGMIAGKLKPTRQPWLLVKLGALGVIVANTALVVVPAATRALAGAQASSAAGTLLPAFQRAYGVETAAGSLNVVLMLIAAAAGVWRFKARAAATST